MSRRDAPSAPPTRLDGFIASMGTVTLAFDATVTHIAAYPVATVVMIGAVCNAGGDATGASPLSGAATTTSVAVTSAYGVRTGSSAGAMPTPTPSPLTNFTFLNGCSTRFVDLVISCVGRFSAAILDEVVV